MSSPAPSLAPDPPPPAGPDPGDAGAAPPAIEDLRFTIGLFFLLISAILLIAAALPPAYLPPGAAKSGLDLNLRAGLLMLAFAVVMLTLFARGRRARP